MNREAGKGDTYRPVNQEHYNYGYELAFGGAMILPCNCKHVWQDNKYGKGNRVHTEATGNKSHKYTCSVCGSKK